MDHARRKVKVLINLQGVACQCFVQQSCIMPCFTPMLAARPPQQWSASVPLHFVPIPHQPTSLTQHVFMNPQQAPSANTVLPLSAVSNFNPAASQPQQAYIINDPSKPNTAYLLTPNQPAASNSQNIQANVVIPAVTVPNSSPSIAAPGAPAPLAAPITGNTHSTQPDIVYTPHNMERNPNEIRNDVSTNQIRIAADHDTRADYRPGRSSAPPVSRTLSWTEVIDDVSDTLIVSLGRGRCAAKHLYRCPCSSNIPFTFPTTDGYHV